MSFKRELVESGSSIYVRLFKLRHCEILIRITLFSKRGKHSTGYKDVITLLAGALFELKDLQTLHTSPQVEKERLEDLDVPDKELVRYIGHILKCFLRDTPGGGRKDKLLKFNVQFELVVYRIDKYPVDVIYVTQLECWSYHRIKDLTREILTINLNEWCLTSYLECSTFAAGLQSKATSVYGE